MINIKATMKNSTTVFDVRNVKQEYNLFELVKLK